MANEQICARLVYDGGTSVTVPPEMGMPRNNQMCGTPAERLTELAARVCYDSLGSGRPSQTSPCDKCFGTGVVSEVPGVTSECQSCRGKKTVQGFHDHILEVKHGSVHEHFNFTVSIDAQGYLAGAAVALLNRPGVYATWGHEGHNVTITANLRSVYEWERHNRQIPDWAASASRSIGASLQLAAFELAPQIVSPPHLALQQSAFPWKFREPKTSNGKWISMFMAGSRGWSHEQCRHRNFCAISQRSTRYVNESETNWIYHPLLVSRLSELTNDPRLAVACAEATNRCAALYNEIITDLEPWLTSRGVDRTAARKQARGAARGFLGNALATEMIFSASVAQWRWMIALRASAAADAEIRQVFALVISELKRSRYGNEFDDISLVPSPDGIGMVAQFDGGTALSR